MKIHRILLLVTSLVGIISIFLPWIKFFGRTINGLDTVDGFGYFVYVFLLCFVITGILSFVGNRNNPLSGIKKMIITIVIGLPMIVFFFSYPKIFDLMDFWKIGLYLWFISTIIILLTTIFVKK